MTTSSPPSHPPAVAPDPRSARKAVWASFVGTSLESYDFYVFAYFSAIFSAPLFFPEQDPIAGTISAFLVLATSYVVRPVGAILFGHLGDRIGRKKTLIVTITIMGVATGLIGVLPGFATIGLLAPILLTVLPVIQGLSLGGDGAGRSSSPSSTRTPGSAGSTRPFRSSAPPSAPFSPARCSSSSR